MNMMCSRCKERMAVLFISREENGSMKNEGICLKCAKELNIPQIKSVMDRMGISDEEIEAMNNQMVEISQDLDNGFEMGGAQSMPFLKSMLGDALAQPGNVEKEKRTEQKKAKEQEKKKRKFLDNFCENLTEKAKNKQIDRIVGRDNEIYRVMQILNRRTKNNPCLIGEPGVGKTAIAEGIAQKLAEGSVPYRLADKELYLLDLTALVAGTQFRGQFEGRVKGLIGEIKEAGNVILFIDEVHNLVGAGDSEGSMNAANILKPALSRGEIQVIGATTFNEYRKYIEKDAALERRFQPVKVNEPSIEDAVGVIMGIKPYYEKFHRLTVPDNIARNAVVLSERYITDRFLPDKAIDLLDEACSAATMENKTLAVYDALNDELKRLNQRELEIEQESEIDYESIAKIKSDRIKLTADIKAIEQEALGMKVTNEHLAKVIELWTGIPASKIQETELRKVSNLENRLKEKIIGQDAAIELVSAAVKRSRAQITARRRPSSFIFVGPTGVGKTELVKQLSRELFDDTDPLIRLDMSEFMEKHSVSRIVGSPPGYVGYDEAGQLTEKVRRRPYSVILFDEIEKAHPDVMNILLQILDEGRITDAQGRTVNFENTVIVMTSNAGSQLKGGSVGFNKLPQDASAEKAQKALSDFLRPEFIGRVDEVVVFNPLDEEAYGRIAGLMLDELVDPLKEKGIEFGYEPEALSLIAKQAYGKKSGARDLRRVIRQEVEDKVSTLIVDQSESLPGLIKVVVQDGALAVLTA